MTIGERTLVSDVASAIPSSRPRTRGCDLPVAGTAVGDPVVDRRAAPCQPTRSSRDTVMNPTRTRESQAQSQDRQGPALAALRAYLAAIADAPTFSPREEAAHWRQIDAEYRALTAALLAVPS